MASSSSSSSSNPLELSVPAPSSSSLEGSSQGAAEVLEEGRRLYAAVDDGLEGSAGDDSTIQSARRLEKAVDTLSRALHLAIDEFGSEGFETAEVRGSKPESLSCV